MIEIRGATVRYGAGPPVLRDVSLSFAPGRVVGVIGPNGAGKSTLLRALLGLVEVSGGTVTIDGRDLHGLGRRELARRVSYLPQSASHPFPFSALQIVLMGRYPHLTRFRAHTSADVACAEKALRDADAWHLRDGLVTEMSGGERQRVYLARTFATEAPALLLDEPLSNLDIHHSLDLLDILRRKREEGRLVLITIHDLNHAFQACDDLVLLRQGTVVAAGPKPEVFRRELLEAVFSVGVDFVAHPDGQIVHFTRRQSDQGLPP